MLDIDEIGAGIPGDLRGRDIILDQLLDFAVAPDLVVAGHFEFAIQNGMTISDARFHSEFIVWFAEASRMR